MSIAPATISEQEAVGLLLNDGKFELKIKALNELLTEINDKIAIANTIKKAETMAFQSESMMLDAKALNKKAFDDDVNMKKQQKTRMDTLRNREARLTDNETAFLAKKKAFDSDIDSYKASSSSFERSVVTFDEKHKKMTSELARDRRLLDATRERMFEVHHKALKDLTEV